MDEARDRDNCRSSRPGTTNEVCRTKYHPPCSILELQRLAKRTASTSPSLARARSRSPVTLSRGAPRAWPPFLSTGHPPEELLPGPLLNSRHLHQPRLQRPIHILGPPRNQQQLAPSHDVPCPHPLRAPIEPSLQSRTLLPQLIKLAQRRRQTLLRRLKPPLPPAQAD